MRRERTRVFVSGGDIRSSGRGCVMEAESYNGWANYPTWCVNLWLSNDEGLYVGALERTRAVLEVDDHPTSEYWTEAESKRFNTADTLKAWVEVDLVPDLGASFPADLLGWALGHVDWREIADAWIETAGGQVTS